MKRLDSERKPWEIDGSSVVGPERAERAQRGSILCLLGKQAAHRMEKLPTRMALEAGI